jgi:energy-coupling factor transporter ATP-binding protein EcfA2
MNSILTVQNLHFRYAADNKWLFQDFNLDCKQGEITLLKGESGSGKTTLLYLLCGIIPKMIDGEMQGKILFEEHSLKELTLPQIAPKISLMMQMPDVQLFFPTVEMELAFAPENLCLPRSETQKRIEKVCRQFEISHLLQQDTATLSFGQKKMVTFGALLTLSPQIFLLDEPTAGLSEHNSERIKSVLTELKQAEKTIIIAEHSAHLDDLADKIVELQHVQT